MEIDPPYGQCYLILYFTIYRQNYLCQTTFNELKDVKYALRITQAISILPKNRCLLMLLLQFMAT